MKNYLKFSLVPFIFLIGCSPKDKIRSHSEHDNSSGVEESINISRELIPEAKIETKSYQLGDDWDQTPTPAFHKGHSSIFRAFINTPEGVESSNFLLIEKINESEAFFAGTEHSLTNSCENTGIEFLSQNKVFKVECTGLFSKVPETDIIIFSVKFTNSDELAELKAVQLSNKNFNFGERLRFFGIGLDDYIPGYYPLITDSNKDCRLISNREEKITDPDSFNTIIDERYWSFAVTCDVQHGDSGGMLVNRDGDLVGILWTGAFPKKSIYNSDSILEYINVGSQLIDESLWTDFNYITPAYRIFDHLERIKTN